MIPPIPPEIIAGAVNWAKKGIVTIVAPAAWGKIKDYYGKPHGSKVKMGAYQDCLVELFGDKACIMADAGSGEVVFLTADTIQSCHYVKKKKKTVGLKQHTYYYYNITFKDGSESYVRMRKKYREAMQRCGVYITE